MKEVVVTAATPDKQAIAVTALVSCLVVYVIVQVLRDSGGDLLGIGVSVLVVGWLAYMYFSRVTKYILEDDLTLKQVNGFGAAKVLSKFDKLDAKKLEQWPGSYRLWGTGGLWGYYGLFHLKGIGRCRFCLTNRSQALILYGNDGPVLISPSNTEPFLSTP